MINRYLLLGLAGVILTAPNSFAQTCPNGKTAVEGEKFIENGCGISSKADYDAYQSDAKKKSTDGHDAREKLVSRFEDYVVGEKHVLRKTRTKRGVRKTTSYSFEEQCGKIPGLTADKIKAEQDRLLKNSDEITDYLTAGDDQCRGIGERIYFKMKISNGKPLNISLGTADNAQDAQKLIDSAMALHPDYVACTVDKIESGKVTSPISYEERPEVSSLGRVGQVFNDNSAEFSEAATVTMEKYNQTLLDAWNSPDPFGREIDPASKKMKAQVFTCASMMRNCADASRPSWGPKVASNGKKKGFCATHFKGSEDTYDDYFGKARSFNCKEGGCDEIDSFRVLSSARRDTVSDSLAAFAKKEGINLDVDKENPDDSADPYDPFSNWYAFDPKMEELRGTCGPPAPDSFWGAMCDVNSYAKGKKPKSCNKYSTTCKQLFDYYNKPEVIKQMQVRTGKNFTDLKDFYAGFNKLKTPQEREEYFSAFRYMRVVPELERKVLIKPETKISTHYVAACRRLDYTCSEKGEKERQGRPPKETPGYMPDCLKDSK